jgi:cation diffusion facilitator family transporter
MIANTETRRAASRGCCADKACAVDLMRERQEGVLRIVLLLNGTMFVVELVAGLMAGSVAVLADALDMLGDALVYGFSLYVVGRGARWKAWGAVGKAAAMAVFGIFVLGQLVYRLIVPEVPRFELMGGVGVLAMACNVACFLLLWRRRADDLNMRSVWLCSRNDLVANAAVLLAAAGVWALASPWPDIAAGAFIGALFLRSAFLVAREARRALASGQVA